jgi:hypothetical protein
VDNNLLSKIRSVYKMMHKRQELIENDAFEDNTPGRKRDNPYRKSEKIYELIRDYLFLNLKNLVKNKRNQARPDAMMTFFIRVVKKLTLHLVKTCATVSLYKSPLIEDYSVSFAESHFAFLTSINKTSEICPLVSFAEYIILYFSDKKALAILNNLISLEECKSDSLQVQLNLLKQRKKTSKTHFQHWVNNSGILRHILKVVLEVIQSPEFPKNVLTTRLIQNTQSLLSEH